MIQRLPLTISLALLHWLAYTQCPPGPLGTGNFLDKPSGCATFGLDIEFTPLYSQLEDNSIITIDWGDGSANDVINVGTTGSQSGITYNTPVLHTYTEANTAGQCVYEIQASVTGPNGCYTIEETTVTAEIVIWNTDNFPDLQPDPLIFEICAGTSSSITFEDMSPWNCTDPGETTSLNQNTRWTQWIYGNTNTISGTVLLDGTAKTYPFSGIINEHPGPILAPQAPGNESLEIFVPASANIGEEFSIQLHNWNQCNPYEDAGGTITGNASVSREAIIRVVAPPDPEYQVREGGPTGALVPFPNPVFCINEDIYFENLTVGAGYNYIWQFYDGDAATDPILDTFTDENVTYQYTVGGNKLVRLIASDPNADGVCDVIFDEIISLSPDAVAAFEFFNETFSSTIDPSFCQSESETFTIGFRDITELVPNTELRFEFFEEGNPPSSGLPDYTFPTDGTYVSGANVAEFTRDFTVEGLVIVRLEALNTATACSSIMQDTIFIYGRPLPTFSFEIACEGDTTSFFNIADPITSLSTQVNEDQVSTYEWDFSYDGITFNPEFTSSDNSAFKQFLGPAGTYEVALRMTTAKGGCSDITSLVVPVNPNPDAQFTIDATGDICPGDFVSFTNTSSNATATTYTLKVDHAPSGTSLSVFLDGSSSLPFDNPDDTTRTYVARINAVSEDGCSAESNTLLFRVSPDENAEISDPNYSFFGTNCSPWVSTMVVAEETVLLSAASYTWTLLSNGEVYDGYPITVLNSSPTFNTFDYQIENTSNTISNYQMVLEADKTGLCIANDTFNLQISPQPDASFLLERQDECDRVIFSLEALQKGLADYDWQFSPLPDQQIGGDDEIEVSFDRNENGLGDINATVMLVTTNLAACTSNPEVKMEVLEEERPEIIAAFTVEPIELQLPENTVTITNSSVTVGNPTFLWDFGDGTTSTDSDPETHMYNQFGTYQITLEITDEFCTEKTSQTVTVFPTAPILDFEADILEGCAPLTVQFTNLSEFAVSGEFLWEFGDGSISRSDNPTHTFFQDGTFTVRLRGENEVGETSEIQRSDYITIYGRPFADFLVSTRVVFIPDQQAIFRNLSDNANIYSWDFGDGSTSTEENPRHAYTEEGFYDITLIASNDFGCVDTLFRAAEVEAISGGQVNTPNAFTPSLDGSSGGEVAEGGMTDPSRINDVFLPRLEGVERFRMFIYNKWGELIFQSESQTKGWDGYYKNRLAPAGVYVYKLELRFSDGQDVVRVGDVTLIR